MADVDYDVQAQAAVGGDGLIHGCVKHHHERFEVRVPSSGTVAQSRGYNAWALRAP